MACDRIAEAFSLVQITLMFIKARSLNLLDDIRCKKENSKLIITFIYMLKKKKKTCYFTSSLTIFQSSKGSTKMLVLPQNIHKS